MLYLGNEVIIELKKYLHFTTDEMTKTFLTALL